MTDPDDVKERIKKLSRSFSSRRKAIFTKNDLQSVVIETLSDVGASQKALIRSQLLDYLSETGKLREVVFGFPSRKETRYLFGNVSNFELAQSLKPNAYIAFRAAMYLHGLCDEYPDVIHINVEQAQHHKRNANSLTQTSLDQAFARKGRVSNEIASANETTVCITHGQRTNQLAVERIKRPDSEQLLVTSLERTLIDITVRPINVGGPKEVLSAYRKATKLSPTKLLKILKEMNFVYPYQQAVGFYLEASGNVSEQTLNHFREMRSEFDFYLDYKISNPNYSKEWKLYYPEDLFVKNEMSDKAILEV